MIPHEVPAAASSLWTATAHAAPPCPPLEGRERADVAVVGGGFTGLSAAIALSERGVDVALLEAETPGWGASGRNGGQVIPGLKHDPDAVEHMLGSGPGAKAVALSGEAPGHLFDLIARHGIDCDAVRAGWIQPVHDPSALATSRGRAAQWARRGAPVRSLDRDETAALTGSEGYVAGLLDERGGSVHPLNLALGMAAAARRLGARIHGHSRVERLERRGEGLRLHCGADRLDAGHVLLCTNGYSDGLIEPLRRSIVPVCSVQVATEPLPADVRAGILPQGHAASDTRRQLVYFRLDRDGRLLIGGRGAYGQRGMRRQHERLRRTAVSIFPQIGAVRWPFHWGGFIAMTPDHLPRLREVGPGITAGLGYNGRGVALATAMGRVLARRALGVPDAELELPLTRPTPIRFHGGHRAAVSAVAAWYGLRDRAGL